jgi:hypothetical protein
VGGARTAVPVRWRNSPAVLDKCNILFSKTRRPERLVGDGLREHQTDTPGEYTMQTGCFTAWRDKVIAFSENSAKSSVTDVLAPDNYCLMACRSPPTPSTISGGAAAQHDYVVFFGGVHVIHLLWPRVGAWPFRPAKRMKRLARPGAPPDARPRLSVDH